MGVAKIVKTNVAQVRLGADPRPEMVQPASTLRCSDEAAGARPEAEARRQAPVDLGERRGLGGSGGRRRATLWVW